MVADSPSCRAPLWTITHMGICGVTQKKIKTVLKASFARLNIDHQSLKRVLIREKFSLVRNQFPKTAHIEISGSCQLNCVYCDVGLREISNKNLMATQEFERVLDQLNGLKSTTLTIMTEPLLNKQIPNMISMAAQKGIEIDFPTNGAFFPEPLQEKVLQAGLGAILFSIDTMDSEYFAELRPPAKLNNVLSNMKSFHLKRDALKSPCRIMVAAIINDNMIADIDYFVDTSLEYGADTILLRIPHVWKTDESSPLEMLSMKLDDVWEILNRAKLKYGDKISFGRENKQTRKVKCDRPFNATAIKVDGRVVPCCLQASDPDKIQLGNILTQDFESIWNGEKYQEFRRPFLEGSWDPICEGCPVLMGQY